MEPQSNDDPDLERTANGLMQRAAEACEALELDDPLRAKMLELLGDVRSRITETREDRGRRPPIPDKRQYVNKLGAMHTRRPARTAAYDAVEKLLNHVWRPQSSTERNRKKRRTGALVPLNPAHWLRTGPAHAQRASGPPAAQVVRRRRLAAHPAMSTCRTPMGQRRGNQVRRPQPALEPTIVD